MRTQSYTQDHSKRRVTECPRCETHTSVDNCSENGQLNGKLATEHMPESFQVGALQQNIVVPFLTLWCSSCLLYLLLLGFVEEENIIGRPEREAMVVLHH